MARLPQPGGDSGNWGTILNDYLAQAHDPDGKLKDNAVTGATIQDGVISETLLDTNVQTKLNAPANIADGSLTKVKLVGDVQSSLDKADNSVQSVVSARSKTTRWFNVEDYGAKGNGSTDDTAAFQAAVVAAIAARGTLYIPSPSVSYMLSDTIELQASSNGAQFFMNIRAEGPFIGIKWVGANNKSMFHSLGWKRSYIENVQIRIDTVCSNIVVWDIDGDPSPHGSSSHLTFTACHVSLTSAPTFVTGWRFGHSADAATDFSYITFNNCTLSAPTGVTNNGDHVGFRVESANALHFQWFGGGVYNCHTGFSNIQSAGANSSGIQGGPTMYFYGFGNSGVTLDFEIKTPGQYIVSGGRFELGQRFVELGKSISLTGADVHVSSVTLASYAPTDGIVFNVGGSSTLMLDNVEVRPPTASADYTAAMITANGSVNARGAIIVRGGKYRAAEPFFTIASGGWAVDISSARQIDSSLQATNFYRRVVWHTNLLSSADVLTVAHNAGSVGTNTFVAFQGSTSITTRGRVGFDGSNNRILLSDASGGRDVALESGSTTPRQLVTATAGGNVHLGAKGATDGSGVKTVYISNASTLPTVNPVGGGILFVDNGALKYRGTSGTVTTIAPA